MQTDGDDIIDRVARDDPGKLADIMAKVLPRELSVNVETRTGPFDGTERAKVRRLLDVIDAAAALHGEETVFAWIEEDVRARMSRQVRIIEGIAREQEGNS